MDGEQNTQHHEDRDEGLLDPGHERGHAHLAFQGDFVRVVEDGVEGPQQAPEDHQRKRHGRAGRQIVVGVLGELEHLQGGKDAGDHDEGGRGLFHRREQLVVKRRLGLGRELLEVIEDDIRHHPAEQHRANQEERGDHVMGDRVLTGADIEGPEHRIHEVLQKIRRTRRRLARGRDGGGGGGVGRMLGGISRLIVGRKRQRGG